jgi:hypothetical protein
LPNSRTSRRRIQSPDLVGLFAEFGRRRRRRRIAKPDFLQGLIGEFEGS